MTMRHAGDAGRPRRMSLSWLAIAAASLGLLATSATAHIRTPDYGSLVRKAAGRAEQRLDPMQGPRGNAPASRSTAGSAKPCHGLNGKDPLTAFAGFAGSAPPSRSTPFLDVKVTTVAADATSSSEPAPLHQLLHLLDAVGTAPGPVEVAHGITWDGSACPVYLSVGSGAHRQTFWRFGPPDEPEGWFDDAGRRLGGAPLGQPKPVSRISSPFGPRRYYGRVTGGGFHDGIDFEARIGQPVFAAADGVIEHEGWYFQYGLTIKIRHAPEFTTLYAHLSRFAEKVSLGSMVRKGDLIGYIGMTGRSTGPHLHFSTIANGKFVNPAPYLSDTGDHALSRASLAAFRRWQELIDAAVRAGRDHHEPREDTDWTTRT
jgi:murein DD-endopeptidase MepM/ murein hydrolase activator NlpD